MKKIVSKIVVILLLLCSVAYSGCQMNGTESVVTELCSAKSFTVIEGKTTILKYSENKAYWKSKDDFYFFPDDEGKYWAYWRGYNADTWTKQALYLDEYYSWIHVIKNGIGISDIGFLDFLNYICLDFDSFTIEKEGKYSLVSDMYEYKYYEELVFWSKGGSLFFDFGGGIIYTVSSINSTKVDFPSSLNDAEVGEIWLP